MYKPVFLRRRLKRPHCFGAARLGGLVSASLLLGACDEGVLAPKGPVGEAEKLILFDATVVMLAVVIPVILLAIAFAWWFRAQNTSARYRPQWEYSGRIEIIVWSIPALVVVFLGGIAWISAHKLHPSTPLQSDAAPIDIDVVSMDWKWLFIYPGQNLATVNELRVPVGTPLHLRLTSSSVMNSFFVAQLGSQIYTMPGMITELNLQADVQGDYEGRSVQFSGDGFSDMTFRVQAVSHQAFDEWVANAKRDGASLDQNGYVALAQPSHANAPRTFSAVDPHLFNYAVTAPSMSNETR